MATQQSNSKKAGVKKSSTRSSGTRKSGTGASGAKAAAPRKRAARQASAEQGADSPILPVEQLEGLRKIKPDAVDWVIQQTQIEAEQRRAETTRVNDLIFIEHLLAQVSALLIAVTGILGGSWVAVRGEPWIGFAIAGTVVCALAAAQIGSRRSTAR